MMHRPKLTPLVGTYFTLSFSLLSVAIAAAPCVRTRTRRRRRRPDAISTRIPYFHLFTLQSFSLYVFRIIVLKLFTHTVCIFLRIPYLPLFACRGKKIKILVNGPVRHSNCIIFRNVEIFNKFFFPPFYFFQKKLFFEGEGK